MSESYRVILIVTPTESGKDPEDWWWTDACPAAGDDVAVESVEKLEDGGA